MWNAGLGNKATRKNKRVAIRRSRSALTRLRRRSGLVAGRNNRFGCSRAAPNHDSGAVAVEFALVFLLMLVTSLGAFETGNMLLQWLTAETATQMAARAAAIGALVAPGLSAVSQTPQTSAFGDACAGNADCQFAPVTCTNTGCSANGYSAAAFTQVVAAAQVILPSVTPANLQVQYRPSGLGFVGQPGGPPALITVSLRGITYTSLVLNALGYGAAVLTMPSFATTVVGEHQ